MRRLGTVQQKTPCVFVTEVKQEESKKRSCQPYHVIATDNLNPVAMEADVEDALATEKLDGTCCYVSLYKGQPYLWARLDRKLNKQAEKRFKKYQHVHGPTKGFTWSVEEDFKTVPETWLPAHRVKHLNGLPVPDEHGHIPGWVPVEKDNKAYCWHSSVVDYEEGLALVLRPSADCGDGEHLEISAVPLTELLEQTLELIGTNINANPYGLGTKQRPLHCLVSHGSLMIRSPPDVSLQQVAAWFNESPEGRVEGIVWHCHDGTLVKVHRHHLGLRWPVGDSWLGERQVVIRVSGPIQEYNNSSHLFSSFSELNGQILRLKDIRFDP